MAFATGLDQIGQRILPQGVVPFPRGFAFDAEGRLFLASGIGSNGEGDDTLYAFDHELRKNVDWRVDVPGLSPQPRSQR